MQTAGRQQGVHKIYYNFFVPVLGAIFLQYFNVRLSAHLSVCLPSVGGKKCNNEIKKYALFILSSLNPCSQQAVNRVFIKFITNFCTSFRRFYKIPIPVCPTICPSVCPSVRKDSSSTRRIFMKFEWRIFGKYFEEFQVSLSDKNNGYLTIILLTWIIW